MAGRLLGGLHDPGTKKLLDRVRAPIEATVEPTTRLGNWSATAGAPSSCFREQLVARTLYGTVGDAMRQLHGGRTRTIVIAPVIGGAVGGVTNRYFQQLNALRALAVLAVVATHTVDTYNYPTLVWGEEGVTLFFVISGFLITGIVLDARDAATKEGAPRRTVLRAFYARRFLRIFPIYYLTILAAAVIGFEGVREALWWHVSYLSNWHIAFDEQWNVATHAWSLAVEEQFYLLWPLALLFVPRARIPWVIALTVAIGPATRAVLTAGTDMWRPGIVIITPSALDSLGLGAALAWAWRTPVGPARFVRWAVGAAGALFVVDRVLALFVDGSDTATSVTRLWIPLMFVGVVHAVSSGVAGRIGRTLQWAPVAYIGLVSYGIYLLHPFTEHVLHSAADRFSLPIPGHGLMLFALVSVVSIGVATLSWNLVEAPINRRKDRFPYVPVARRSRSPSVGPIVE
jgi:peptidoglycan/LPS O-acetylase OafA/YrhL